ncbi:hypothetical protein [Achromobacter phage Motura]|uniref:Uncharacterized protein n=1 Tax=Achromobacter phage Motura TaxID=2591403 RepID=A0A514CTD7_9CAUD|nr:hypothetical protein H1O15_gp102 [Achromobacter phage Motura]QDH83724.1 hypothetical protein [Achromobacter phage Motura]
MNSVLSQVDCNLPTAEESRFVSKNQTPWPDVPIYGPDADTLRALFLIINAGLVHARNKTYTGVSKDLMPPYMQQWWPKIIEHLQSKGYTVTEERDVVFIDWATA